MPLKRKICRIGDSKAIFLPKSWIDLLEEKYGKIKAVSMEVNGKLTIRPIIEEAHRNQAKKQT
ncbi:unnamed protein product [marine sediment metagenome]|uniref:SpoVT-AbrB domain-containing protein n=1 Tax=marine sediment metagenome TaxID=412755 RepID=X1BCE9_9ZZZZ